MLSSASMPSASTAKSAEREEHNEEGYNNDHLRTPSAGSLKDNCEDCPESEHRTTSAERPECQSKENITPEENRDKRSTQQSTKTHEERGFEEQNGFSEEDGTLVTSFNQHRRPESILNTGTPDAKEDTPLADDEEHVPYSGSVEVVVPWWAGAFGAVADMDDGCEQRGFYTRRFCGLFFPDNADEATEARR